MNQVDMVLERLNTLRNDLSPAVIWVYSDGATTVFKECFPYLPLDQHKFALKPKEVAELFDALSESFGMLKKEYETEGDKFTHFWFRLDHDYLAWHVIEVKRENNTLKSEFIIVNLPVGDSQDASLILEEINEKLRSPVASAKQDGIYHDPEEAFAEIDSLMDKAERMGASRQAVEVLYAKISDLKWEYLVRSYFSFETPRLVPSDAIIDLINYGKETTKFFDPQFKMFAKEGLARINDALLRAKEAGCCIFELPEWNYDEHLYPLLEKIGRVCEYLSPEGQDELSREHQRIYDGIIRYHLRHKYCPNGSRWGRFLESIGLNELSSIRHYV
jgi:hypothetical protein